MRSLLHPAWEPNVDSRYSSLIEDSWINWALCVIVARYTALGVEYLNLSKPIFDEQNGFYFAKRFGMGPLPDGRIGPFKSRQWAMANAEGLSYFKERTGR